MIIKIIFSTYLKFWLYYKLTRLRSSIAYTFVLIPLRLVRSPISNIENLNINWLTYFLFFTIFPGSSFAAGVEDWHCFVIDNQKIKWTAIEQYELLARNKALSACKNQSKAPQSCKMKSASCILFIDGISTQPRWKCIALDFEGEAWSKKILADKTSAALAAKNYCIANSPLPETCYVNMDTCQNLNKLE